MWAMGLGDPRSKKAAEGRRRLQQVAAGCSRSQEAATGRRRLEVRGMPRRR